MERLSSCYFCGDAVDASVAEYSLVESDRYDVDTDHRIVLCPTCRRKLTDVIERVVSAMFDDDRDPEEVAAGPGDDPMTATDVEAVGSDDGLDTAADPLVDVDGTENGVPKSEDDESEYGDGTADDVEGADGAAADEEAETDEATTAAADSAGAATEEESDGERDGWGDGDVNEDESGVEDDEETESDDSDGGEDDDGQTTAVGASESGGGTDADDGGATAETTDYEKAEFNKIVRLLQNRDFPVEIDELVVVASSAYGIDEPTCHAVIRALVDRGVVEDRGDELVRS